MLIRDRLIFSDNVFFFGICGYMISILKEVEIICKIDLVMSI